MLSLWEVTGFDAHSFLSHINSSGSPGLGFVSSSGAGVGADSRIAESNQACVYLTFAPGPAEDAFIELTQVKAETQGRIYLR